ncbi:MAG: hypothetical protein Ct9H90mP4_12230 [Gammaproteobacteria bacterium]|nr:MAG: hypothetical protein Ct9H90mP4_12230 [Gammaproteobacteria bacterium]
MHFTDVKVPVENRVGEEGKGWTYAKGLLEQGKNRPGGTFKIFGCFREVERQCSVYT